MMRFIPLAFALAAAPASTSSSCRTSARKYSASIPNRRSCSNCLLGARDVGAKRKADVIDEKRVEVVRLDERPEAAPD